ncbi:MAG: insulinase family protein [Lachnospiraceae bacterium]|nr:insulinase family protein [Lachnospiraceae bacterium]
MNIPSTYRLVEKREIEELQAQGYLLSHVKTGARVLCVECDDDNKVFSIGFRTTPESSNGVAHIIEHTVLCGSDKYPAKDPFVELVKGSLNTFLNAMTYPDKTVYPVASCNDKDFKNLMSVYMDAVFHPNIYKTRTFFEQEGWHYELEDKDSPLIYNGVVYNEMKGAYSSADDVLQEEVKQALYPDNAYAYDSGGAPDIIPSLTYEQYIEFHKRYYHPTNSYIYLYGNCDMEERLNWIDEEYLSKYDHIEIDSTVKLQKAFDEPVLRRAQYSITEDESEENNTFLSWNRVVGDTSDVVDMLAFSILDYVLMGAPGAPVKEALIKAGIGSDIYGGYGDSLRQPLFNITAREANASDLEKFEKIIMDTLKNLADNGINKSSLLAGLNSAEFRAKEADFGGYPKGLIYGLDTLSTWLYDDNAAFNSLCYQQFYDELRRRLDGDYFERLIRDKLINNPHGATVVMTPNRGLNDRRDKATADKLAKIKAGLSAEQIEEIVKHTRELKKFQETPSSEEDLEKIPLLTVDDVSKEARELYIDEKELDGVKVIHSDVFSSGISYINMSFDMSGLTIEEIKYASLLSSLMLQLSTENFTYSELGSEILIKTGSINTGVNIFNRNKEVNLRFEVVAKALLSQLDDVASLMAEVVFRTRFDDRDRIHELIMADKSRLASAIMERGNSIGSVRAASYYSDDAFMSDTISGIDYYLMLDLWDKNYDKMYEEIVDKLRAVSDKIFNKNNLIIGYTGTCEDYEGFSSSVKTFTRELPVTPVTKVTWIIPKGAKNEGFKTASQVNYVCRAGSFLINHPENSYSGALQVLKVWLGFEYLWVNIRVKGGAYGAFAAFSRLGAVRFSSYRDPKLSETNSVFDGAPEAIAKLDISERDLTKYILGAINELDTPMTPSRKGDTSFRAYLSGLTREKMQLERDQVLGTTVEELRALAKLIGDALKDNYLCAIGNASQIEENSAMFKTTINIFK